MSPVRTTPAALAALVLIAACTGGDDDASTTSAAVRPGPTAADTAAPTAPSTTQAPTTTVPPIPASVWPVEVPGEELGAAGAVALLPAQAGRGHLLVGWEQAAGELSRPRVWESADGLAWVPAAAPVPDDADTALTVSGAVWFGDQLTLGGTTATSDGNRRAAVWMAPAAGAFDQPAELPLGDRTSVATAIAVGDAGLIVAGWVEDDAADTAFVTVRQPDGSWELADVPDLPEFTPDGVAANGRTIVVTGTDTAPERREARALVSTDAGATFRLADTEAFAGGVGSAFGAVGVTSAGFVTVACAPDASGTRTALGRSVDGTTWTRQDISIVGDEEAVANLSLQGGGCGELAVSGDTVHVGVEDLSGWALAIDASGAAQAHEIPRRPYTVADGTPLIAPTASGLTVVGREVGGLAPGRLPDGTVGTGLPRQRPYVQALSLSEFDGTTVLGVMLFPDVDEQGSGSSSWSSYQRWLNSPDGRVFGRAVRMRDEFRTVESMPFGAVALATVDDSADAGRSGPMGATEAFVRLPEGRWRSSGLIASGPGGEYIVDLGSVGSGGVGVGMASLRDAVTNIATTTPLATSTDGATWTAETVALPPGASGGLESVCSIGETAFAYGWRMVDGVETPIVAVRSAGGAWSVTAPSGIPDTVTVEECTSDGARVVVLGREGNHSRIWVTSDGVSFSRADLPEPEFADSTFAETRLVAGRLVAVGSVTPVDRDTRAAMWTSRDGLTWSEVPVDGFDGPGSQAAASVIAAPDGSIAVAGYDRGAPVVWNLPAAALER